MTTKNRFVKTILFDAAQRSPRLDLLICRGDTERYVLNTKDDMICRSVFVHGEFDLAKLKQSCALLRDRLGIQQLDTIVDVGANIGTICIPAVLRGYARRAVAVEPHPLNCLILRTNVALNGLHDRIEVFECACGADRAGTNVELLRGGDNWGDVRVASGMDVPEPDVQRISVQSRPLDTLTGDLTALTLLWVDTQGFEAEVLRGAAALLARKIPLVLEFDPKMLTQRSGGVAALARTVAGYRWFVDLERPEVERPVSEIVRLAAELESAGRVFTDILIA